MDTNVRNMSAHDRQMARDVMRFVEEGVDRGTIQPPTQTRRIGDDQNQNHLVSTVTANYYRRHVLSMAANVNLSELEDRWLGVQNLQRLYGYEEFAQLLRTSTFTFPENLIVVRFIYVEGSTHPYEYQIIWNSIFTWYQIKQRLEDNTYNNFIFRHDSIAIFRHALTNTNSDLRVAAEAEANIVDLRVAVEAAEANSDLDLRVAVEAEANGDSDDLRVAVEGLPEFAKKVNGDNDCSICYETFSCEQPAKQLPCTHLYHSKCILLWFRYQISCPTCRDKPGPALLNYDPQLNRR